MKQAEGSKFSRRGQLAVAGVTVLALSLAGIGIGSAASAGEAVRSGTFEIGAQVVNLNQGADTGVGKLQPAADAASVGMYGPQFDWPVIPLHTSFSRDGHLISYGTPVGNGNAQAGFMYDNWNPAGGFTAAAHSVSDAMIYDGFCSSSVTLADGRMLMVGGSTSNGVMIYDPFTRSHSMAPSLKKQRWYGTTLRLPNGKILAIGGIVPGRTNAYLTPDDSSLVATAPEIFDGSSWRVLSGADSTALFGAEQNRWWYPRSFNGPDGDVVGISGDRLWKLNTSGDGSVNQTGALPFSPGVAGSQVMYAPGKVLIAGGGQLENADQRTATKQSATVDFNSSSPEVESGAPMHFARNWLNLTVLPTGNVFANGGTIYGTAAGESNSVKQAEIWDPATGKWSLAARAQRTRTYHSVTALMPSGAVFTGGGGAAPSTDSNGVWGPENNLNGELYYPAYLFTDDGDGHSSWAKRPAITAISGDAQWNQAVQLEVGDSKIAGASLISLLSVTHSQNTDQRRVPLTFSQQGSVLSATLPSKNQLPPGDYELTVTDETGVPSAAQILTVRDGAPGLITVADLTVPTAPAMEDHSQQQPSGEPSAPVAPQAPSESAAPVPSTSPSSPPVSVTPAPSASAKQLALLKSGAKVILSSGSQRIGYSGSAVKLVKVKSSSTAFRWRVHVRKGEGAKTVAFESITKPGSYLVRDGSKPILAKKSKVKSFSSRAYFTVREGLGGTGVSLGQQVSGKVRYIVAKPKHTLAVQSPVASQKKAATLQVALRK